MTQSKTLLCAVAVAIGAAVGIAYAALPAQGGAAELSVAETAKIARPVDEKPTDSLHQVHEHQERQGRVASPFLSEHPTRSDSSKPTPPKPQTPSAKRTDMPQTGAPQEIRLVGVVSAESGRRAIVAVGKKQFLLTPGEEKDGITLEALTETEATVATPTGERRLTLASGLTR